MHQYHHIIRSHSILTGAFFLIGAFCSDAYLHIAIFLWNSNIKCIISVFSYIYLFTNIRGCFLKSDIWRLWIELILDYLYLEGAFWMIKQMTYFEEYRKLLWRSTDIFRAIFQELHLHLYKNMHSKAKCG